MLPAQYKNPHVTPISKKKGLDRGTWVNFRPISNLHTVSKILERLFLSNQMKYSQPIDEDI